ncbi:MAG TPA: hypothetical protein VGV61_00970 [Thermoanaerobaculia bacterium]|jgi:hypothetical protein|nr:hypothetical protein [Thermoanaerobaculia bacterium]
MTPGAGEHDLGRAFAARPDRQPAADCPPAERLWDAVQGRLPAPECEAIVEHIVTCSACAEDWRLALELQRELADDAPRPVVASARQRWLPVAWAAGLLLALGLVFRFAVPAPQPVYREAPGATVHSLVPEDRALRRQHFLLRWSSDVPGARYNVLVSREDLEQVTQARGLAAPRFLVPPASLANLPSGSRLLWQVEVLLPGGERRLSPTFFVRLE